jgi:hypothetical protein
MGLVKQWMMEEAEREREQNILRWHYERTGRRARKVTARMVDDYELDEAFEHAMSKDD